MKPPLTPLINVEEKIDRWVGRRASAADSLQTGMQLQATAAERHQSFQHRWWPKGVYRFKTHAEADAWMTQMLARSGVAYPCMSNLQIPGVATACRPSACGDEPSPPRVQAPKLIAS